MTDNALKVSPSLYFFTTSISHGVEIISPGCGVRASLMLFFTKLYPRLKSGISCLVGWSCQRDFILEYVYHRLLFLHYLESHEHTVISVINTPSLIAAPCTVDATFLVT